MVGWHHRHNRHGFVWALVVGDGQGGLEYCRSCGCKELDTTERLTFTQQSETKLEEKEQSYLIGTVSGGFKVLKANLSQRNFVGYGYDCACQECIICSILDAC